MSFYGGKEGRSYHIVLKYDSIESMVALFQQGGQYTTVNFGEYVIIDTPNKQDPTNGCLYRRGFDYLQPINNETLTKKEQPGAGAIYIGQIVGPSGRGPNVIAEVNNSLPSTASLTVASTVTGEDAAGNIELVTLTFSFPKLLIISNETISSSAYEPAEVTENIASTAYPYKYLLDFKIPAGKHGTDANISFNNNNLNNQYFEISSIDYTEREPVYSSSTIPYRTINDITASTIAGSTYARVMDISYTYGNNSTIMPTQIDNITTDSTNFIIKLSNVTEPISVPIPSANLKISGTAASTASLPTQDVEDGTIMEVNSRLYLYQNPNWTEIFSSLFDDLSEPESYVQIGTDSSSLLNNGILFVTSTFNNYWDNQGGE